MSKDPKACACTADKVSNFMIYIKKQILIDSKSLSYYSSVDKLQTLNELLGEVAQKCNLQYEYQQKYFFSIKNIRKILWDSPPESQSEIDNILSLIDELQIMIWSDLCKSSSKDLPMSTELSKEELERYASSKEEQAYIDGELSEEEFDKYRTSKEKKQHLE